MAVVARGEVRVVGLAEGLEGVAAA